MHGVEIYVTYAYAIDVVPLVLEKTCFAGHTFKYKWKTKQKAQFKKCNAEMRKRKEYKSPPTQLI